MYEYVNTFKEVRSILEDLGLKDDAISDNYQSVFNKLNPNPFTFQQVMVDYLAEFNLKSLDFVDQRYWSNGIRVRRTGDVLIVTAVTADRRFVVSDRITHLSGDSIAMLGERYQKLLFNEQTDRQDWHPILKKQHEATVLRGDQIYTFDLKAFEEEGTPEVFERDGFTEVIVHHIRGLYQLTDLRKPLLIDLRDAYGVVPEERINHMAERFSESVFLVDGMTKGSAERLAAKINNQQLVGQETYGQAERLNKQSLGEQFFIYSEGKDMTVIPGTVVELNYETDIVREAAIQLLKQLRGGNING
ncbi:hypothetical protein ERX27_01180 [Macrococcus brunensis]|uniref:Uncharacterized protein n=1 Tax=Macrococcus brunensis TaxID=198483 RepID=A0A4R6BG41_9STAP|nr:hypothetical protein [Macrococcus brunensis]TDL98733.1 hypothetical protein ERX27_01180 [Macrococcus brunensis]